MRIYKNLRQFLKEKIWRIVEERGRITPDMAIYLFKKEFLISDGFHPITSIPSYLILSWALADDRVGIDEEGYLVPLAEASDEEAIAGKILDLVSRLGVVTLRDVRERLGLSPKEAGSALASLTRRGLLSHVRVHDVLSDVPRIVAAYGKGPDKGQLIHRYAKRVLRELTGAREEVRINGRTYDLVGDGFLIEVVCTPLNGVRGMDLREKLSLEGFRKYVVYYTNRRRDMNYLRKSIEKHLDGMEVEVLSLFDAVAVFRSKRRSR